VVHCDVAGGGALLLLGVHGSAAGTVIGTLGAGAVTIGVRSCKLNVTHCGARLGWSLTSGMVLSSAGPASASLLLVATLSGGMPMVLTVGSTLSAGGMVVSLGSVVATPWSTCMSCLRVLAWLRVMGAKGELVLGLRSALVMLANLAMMWSADDVVGMVSWVGNQVSVSQICWAHVVVTQMV